MKTRMAFMSGPHDLKIKEVELPPLEPTQVLIKMKACGICGSDLHCYQGNSAEGRYDIAPYVPGHEWAGEIIEIGSAVTTLKVGQKVCGDCAMQCNICDNCKDGLMPSACINMKESGFRPDSPGGMGEHMIYDEQFVHAFPDEWTYEEGAWIETASISYFGIWGNGGYVDSTDDVVVMGAGPIGLCALMVAKTSGAKVISVEPLAFRREKALQFGADIAIDPTTCDVKEELLKHTSGGPTLIVEASGTDAAIANCFDVAKPSARIRLIGHSIGHKVPVEIGVTIWKTLNIAGSAGTMFSGPKTIKMMDRTRHKYRTDSLITHRMPFDKVVEAFELAINERGNAIKVMLEFE